MWPLFSIFWCHDYLRPRGRLQRDSRAKQPSSPLTSPLLFTLLLIQHQMVMDSHSNSVESVFSSRQCLRGLGQEANVVVSAFRLCRLTGEDHRDTRKRISHRYLTGGQVTRDTHYRYMGRCSRRERSYTAGVCAAWQMYKSSFWTWKSQIWLFELLSFLYHYQLQQLLTVILIVN